MSQYFYETFCWWFYFFLTDHIFFIYNILVSTITFQNNYCNSESTWVNPSVYERRPCLLNGSQGQQKAITISELLSHFPVTPVWFSILQLLLSKTSMKTKGKEIVRLSWNSTQREKEYKRKSKGIYGQIFTNTKEYTLNLVPGCPCSCELLTMKFLFAWNWPLVTSLLLLHHTLGLSVVRYKSRTMLYREAEFHLTFCQANYPAWMVILLQLIPFFCIPFSQVSFHSSQN